MTTMSVHLTLFGDVMLTQIIILHHRLQNLDVAGDLLPRSTLPSVLLNKIGNQFISSPWLIVHSVGDLSTTNGWEFYESCEFC